MRVAPLQARSFQRTVFFFPPTRLGYSWIDRPKVAQTPATSAFLPCTLPEHGQRSSFGLEFHATKILPDRYGSQRGSVEPNTSAPAAVPDNYLIRPQHIRGRGPKESQQQEQRRDPGHG